MLNDDKGLPEVTYPNALLPHCLQFLLLYVVCDDWFTKDHKQEAQQAELEHFANQQQYTLNPLGSFPGQVVV